MRLSTVPFKSFLNVISQRGLKFSWFSGFKYKNEQMSYLKRQYRVACNHLKRMFNCLKTCGLVPSTQGYKAYNS